MASRKDFAGKKRQNNQSASKRGGASPKTKQPAPVEKTQPNPSSKARPAPASKLWKLIIASVLALSGIGFLLFKLSHVDPLEIRETGIAALIEEKTANDNTQIAETLERQPLPPAVIKQNAKVPKPVTAPKPGKNSKTANLPVTEKSVSAEQKEPYKFYEILANSSVETETIAAYKSTPKTAKLKNKTLLQTGSFRNLKDANNMKAILLLNNLPNVTVSKATAASGTWYRVRTGPFVSFIPLKAALIKLNRLKINSLQIPVK